MSWLSELDIFIFGLTLLLFIGEYMEYTPKEIKVFRVINCVVIITVLVFILGNLADAKSGEFVSTMEDFTTVFHTLFKYLIFMYNKNNLKELMDARTERFWKIPHGNEKLARKIRNIYKGVNIVQVVMLADVVPVIEIYFLTPYFNPSNIFIFPSNVFVNSVVMDAFVLFCQYYFASFVAFIVVGYDFIYLSLCTELRVQVKLLKYKLREVFTKTSEDPVSGISICVEYHHFLLSIYERMQKMYSSTLLFHYFVSLVTVCFDMYQSFVGESHLSHELLKFLMLAAIIAQLAFYCVPAELLSSEFTDIAQALYMSKWYKHKPDVQKLMLPIMVKCQRPHFFSAAGLMEINLDAFGSVIRRAFSFCAVIRNVLDK
uniref:Odorant receptor n=1 Tax=Protaetia brevitarsis TaxID=348688 RepID=A0A411HR71_PROBE|nr:odorant receptor [Protaetia brevitarsis]